MARTVARIGAAGGRATRAHAARDRVAPLPQPREVLDLDRVAVCGNPRRATTGAAPLWPPVRGAAARCGRRRRRGIVVDLDRVVARGLGAGGHTAALAARPERPAACSCVTVQ